MSQVVTDALARAQALDPSHSFIVQAPAGSGKTELLTQRFLVLLAQVQQTPEEIIAITFTRKAASEMRARIMAALHFAQTQPEPTLAHQKTTWQLAQRVLQRNKSAGWSLLENPNRLRIQTIDALCAYLTKQMPIAATITAQADISLDPTPLYEQAAFDVFTQYSQVEPYRTACETLLMHLDNNQNALIQLFCAMLAKRDQWLPHLMQAEADAELRQQLEAGFQSVSEYLMQQVYQRLDEAGLRQLLTEHCQRAARYQAELDHSGLEAWVEATEFPTPCAQHLPAYLSLCELLLTKEQQFRKTVTQKQGCPAPSSGKTPQDKAERKAHKQALLAILEDCCAAPGLLETLQALCVAPHTHYTETQWATTHALWQLLPIAAAQLLLLFNQAQQVDFVAVAMDAREALGDEEHPTDLSLALDYKIQHLLIDEFQDTSRSQFSLLKQLTQGWQPGDGRTLFLVGDPMQSIYRFREADVSLFLQAKTHGIGDIQLTPLTLQVNFRTDKPLIDWFNQSFDKLFPQQSDPQLGAIAYSPSQAFNPGNQQSQVITHCTHDATRVERASVLLNVIHAIQQQQPMHRIAILVRARTHLTEIIDLLRTHHIAYSAVDIEPLISKPIVLDLWTLTQALYQPEHRIAWLALLRSPLIGCTLSDLLQLSERSTALIWQCLINRDDSQLSEHAQQRLKQVCPILSRAQRMRAQLSMRQLVEETWLALGGPAGYNRVQTGAVSQPANALIEDTDAYFELLELCDAQTHVPDLKLIEQRLTQLYAKPCPQSDNPIQVMTIHKSKGLEFDQVILPELARSNTQSSSALLNWAEFTDENNQNHLLIAPIEAYAESNERMNTFLKFRDKQKAYYEMVRLLYVACTRAKHQLHLMLDVQTQADQIRPPIQGSLLKTLWPVIEDAANQPKQVVQFKQVTPVAQNSLIRLHHAWRTPFPLQSAQNAPMNTADSLAQLRLTDEQIAAQHLGVLIHMVLQMLGEQRQSLADFELVTAKLHWQYQLDHLGTPIAQQDAVLSQASACLQTLKSCPVAQWILDPRHSDSHCEWALSETGRDGAQQQYILDRSFVDAQGVRWIVDYKTAQPAPGESLEAFLASQQQRHSPQLQRYAQCLQRFEDRPIQLGLYFPMIAAWHAWAFMPECINLV